MKKLYWMAGLVGLIFAGCITINVPEAEVILPTSLPSVEEIGDAIEEELPVIIEELEDVELTFDSETFVDEAAGFELEIPADWYEGVVEQLEQGYSTTFQSWPMSGGDTGPQTSGGDGDQPGEDPDGDGNGQTDGDGEGETDGNGDGGTDGQSDGGSEGQSNGEEDPPANESILTVEVLAWEPANDLNAFLNYWRETWASEGKEIAAKQEWNINQKRRAVFFVVKDAEGGTTYYFFTQLKDKYLVLVGKGDLRVVVQIAKSVELKDY